MRNYENIEVNGQTINSFLDALKEDQDEIVMILKNCKINDINLDSWYLITDWLKAFKKITDDIGQKTLFTIGKSILDNALLPPNINEIHSALALIDVAYHMNHRINGEVMFNPSNGEMLEGIGNYKYKKISENTGIMIADNPYPCEFDRGIIISMARRFKPLVQVVLDTTKQNRNDGGESSTYLISW